jgi:hypothetical protein
VNGRGVAVFCALLLASISSADAQNLFEVQVFPDENVGRNETGVEIHNVLMPSGTRLGDDMFDPNSHLHLSVELTHGWTDAFETGFFFETAPSGPDRHATFTGWHFRPKFRFPEWRRLPFHVSLSLEYALFKQPGDAQFRQAVALTPILERHIRAMEVSVNPTLEVGVTRAGARASPVFEPSAKIASRLKGAVWLGVEYYAETGSIKHFDPLSEQRHILIPAVDVRSVSGWDFNIGIGRGLTGGSEHWVAKSILGYRFRGRVPPAAEARRSVGR